MAIANPENYLTQASADARYQAVGSLGSSTPAQVDAGDTGTAGVSSSAARQDHEHPVGITSAQLVPAAAIAAWVSWTPTLTNLTLGNGTVTARYVQFGKTVHFHFVFTMGSTSAMGTAPRFSLPVAMASHYVDAVSPLGDLVVLDSGTALFQGAVIPTSGEAGFVTFGSAGATVNHVGITATAPMVWTTSDRLDCTGTYEAA